MQSNMFQMPSEMIAHKNNYAICSNMDGTRECHTK